MSSAVKIHIPPDSLIARSTKDTLTLSVKSIINEKNVKNLTIMLGQVTAMPKAVSGKFAGSDKNTFLCPILTKHPDGTVLDRIYLQEIIVDMRTNVQSFSGNYGTDFVTVGIKAALYKKLLTAACNTGALTPMPLEGITNEGYVWTNAGIRTLHASNLGYATPDGKHMVAGLTEIRQRINSNVIGIGVVQTRLKCTVANGNMDDARSSGRWNLGLTLDSFFVYSDTTLTSGVAISSQRQSKVKIPTNLAFSTAVLSVVQQDESEPEGGGEAILEEGTEAESEAEQSE